MAAEIEGRIKIVADTGAAQNAIGKLADEQRGLAKATDGAGNAVKDLTRQQAALAQVTVEAREAVDRLRRAEAEAKATAAAFGAESREAADAQARLKRAQEEAARATKAQAQALDQARLAAAQASATADAKTTPAVKRMGTALERASKDAERTASDLRTLEARMAQGATAAGGFRSALAAAFGGATLANAAASLAGRVGDLGVHALSTAANYERLQTALTTSLGSTEAASAKFAELQAFAAATPFSLEEVTEGFIKLKNRGLDPSARALTAYGNTASAMGKTLDDMVEAVADAATMEFERLKEFGIKSSKQGDQVAFTFRGVTTMVKAETKAIEEHLMHLGELHFAGGMEAQSRTLAGLWSTLKDGFDQWVVSVMNSGITDGLKSIMSGLSELDGTGRLLADVLSLTLGSAVEVLGMVFETAAPLVDVFGDGLAKVTGLAVAAKDAIGGLLDDAMSPFVDKISEAAEAQRVLNEERASALAQEAAGKPDAQWVTDATAFAETLILQAKGHLAAAEAAKIQEDALARLAAKWAKEEAKFDDAAFEESMQIGPRFADGSFEHKAKAKKGAKKKKKDPAMEAIKKFSFGGAEAGDPLGGMWEADFEAESQAREARLTALDREREAMEAAGQDASRIIAERLDAEIALARWQERNSLTLAQRDAARTRREQAEHAKRIAGIKAAHDAEAREMERKTKIAERVTDVVTSLGTGMVDILSQAADAERGVMAQMLADLLKGVAKQHAVLALGEAAKGVAAQAITWGYPNPKALAHFAAAGMHTGVAVAAGFGAAAAGAVAEQRSGGGAGRSTGDAAGFGRSGSGGGGATRGGAGGDDGLEAQEVPVSHEQLRRDQPVSPRSGGGAQVVISGTVNIYGAGGKVEFIDEIERALDRRARRGKRALN